MSALRLSFLNPGYDIRLNAIWLPDIGSTPVRLNWTTINQILSNGPENGTGSLTTFVVKGLRLDSDDSGNPSRIRNMLADAIQNELLYIEAADAENGLRVPQLLLMSARLADMNCVYDMTSGLRLPRKVIPVPAKLRQSDPADDARLVGMAAAIHNAMETYMDRRCDIGNDTLAMFVARQLDLAGFGMVHDTRNQ